MPERSILDEAAAAVNGPRRRDYDHPTVNHDRIARLWSAYLEHPVDRNDVVHMMILLKIARSQHRYTRDNAVDMAGYAQCLSIMNEGPFPEGWDGPDDIGLWDYLGPAGQPSTVEPAEPDTATCSDLLPPTIGDDHDDSDEPDQRLVIGRTRPHRNGVLVAE